MAGRWCRTVSRGEGEALAARLDCAYFETSAAEDLDSVTTAFGRVLGDVLRLHDRQPTLQVQSTAACWTSFTGGLELYVQQKLTTSQHCTLKYKYNVNDLLDLQSLISASCSGGARVFGTGAEGQKTRMMALPGRERSLTISSALLIQYTNVTDRRTDTGRQQRPRLRIASHGKNRNDLDNFIDFIAMAN